MDDSNKIKSFEEILKKNTTKKPKLLYRATNTSINQNIKPQDVLENVYSEIKRIQLADGKCTKLGNKDTRKVKKSSFLPVNKLPMYNEIPKETTNRFETQCVSDTQLINLIKDAEAQSGNNGITQEFNGTFNHLIDSNCAVTVPPEDINRDSNTSVETAALDAIFNANNNGTNSAVILLPDATDRDNSKFVETLEIDIIFNDLDDENSVNTFVRKETDRKSCRKDKENHAQLETNVCLNKELFKNNAKVQSIKVHPLQDLCASVLKGNRTSQYALSKNSIIIKVPQSSKTDKFDGFDNIVEKTDSDEAMKNKDKDLCIIDEDHTIMLNDSMDIDIDEIRIPSPVLQKNIKSKETKLPIQPLVVSLKKFEEFERIVQPLISSNKNINTLKHLINSQLLGAELCLITDVDYDCQKSPIFEKNEDFHNSCASIVSNELVNIEKIKDTREKRSDSLKDEILFSSDEENDYIHKEFLDMPLTAALETSFYDHCTVLEETMFVGFQTASNKSIKICTDSFHKAQSILQDDENIKNTNFNLTELVEICDEKNICRNADLNQDSISIKPKKEEAFKLNVLDKDCYVTASSPANFNNTEQSSVGKASIYNFKTKLNSAEYDDIVKISPENHEFVGFKTASNKKLEISDKAYDKGKQVFMDIDLYEKEVSQADLKAILEETEVENDVKNKLENVELDDKINDALIIQEFENVEMSLEAKDVDEKDFNESRETVFDGFKTASNKNILISNVAMSKIKNIFQDIDFGEIKENDDESDYLETNPVSKHANTFTGFKTANDKEIEVSALALAETKNIFQDVEILDINYSNKTTTNIAAENLNQLPTSKESVLGFKTANYKNIKISEEALSKSKHIFKDIIHSKTDNDFYDKEVKPFKGFKTSNNKNYKDFNQALHKICKLQDVDSNDENADTILKTQVQKVYGCKDSEQNKSSHTGCGKVGIKKVVDSMNLLEEDNLDSGKTFVGFKTASSKNVSISKVALEKCKKILCDLDDLPYETSTEAENQSSKDTWKSVRFQTANNKKFEALREAMDITKNIFDVDDTCENKEIESFMGFQTASNKKVKISKEALAKTKTVFNDIDVPQYEEESLTVFKTANKNKVDVSKEALQQTKNLSNDTGVFVSNESRPFVGTGVSDSNESRPFVGFQTASKKIVKVSKKAVEKAKHLFNDIDNDEQQPFAGFQTASEKKVLKSEEDLAKSKNICDDFEISNDKNFATDVGFQTASKNKVMVSKKAIEKSKTILNAAEVHEDKQAFSGFQTVTKQKVVISKEAKSKHTFPDINFAGENNFKTNEKGTDKHSDMNDVTPNNSVYSTQISNMDSKISEKALWNIKMTLQADNIPTVNNNFRINKTYKKDLEVDTDIALDTQVANHFDESLCTEDFKETPQKNKRSGSPILSCPKAKKKKFATPYKTETVEKTENIKSVTVKDTSETANLKFTENYKKIKVYTLKDLANLGDSKSTDIDPFISHFNLENILDFEFKNVRNDLTDTKITIADMKKLFLNAVNKNLVPDGWLNIHLKLILWKLLSYEMKFPNLGVVCTVNNVIDQLKYRYDKELYNAERSALRKIYERDDVSTKTMVLCVAGIYVDGVAVSSVSSTDNIELLLTDGWYFIKATIDKMLSKLVYDGRIVVGCKIGTSGAELVNCEQGMYPWEGTSAVRLKLFGNSTRLAKWDSKLGYTSAAILTDLSSVKVDGGKICKLRVFVTRVYPLLYVEKFEDGSTVTRSERLEHLHQITYENERDLMMERIYEEVQKEFSEQDSQDSEGVSSPGKRRALDSGSQIAKIMKTSKDPMEFRAQLTSSQMQMLQEHTSRYREKLLQAIHNRIQEKLTNRNVVTLARGRVAAVKRDGDTNVITKGMLSIWKPNDVIMEMFKEGSWIEVMNVVPTAIRYSEIQISAGRQSVFRSTKCRNEIHPCLLSLKRKCYIISDVTQNPAMTTDYNEIDTVGMVFLIEPNNRDFKSSHNFQNVYIADADKNMISVNFWGGIKKFGFENILDTGQVVSCANLQKRAGNTRKSIPQFRVTEFSYFTKTPKNVQAREMVEDLNKKLFSLDRRKFCEDCIAIKKNYTAIRCLNSIENESPYRNNFNSSDYNLARNKIFIDTPKSPKANKNEDLNFNLTGLDFESTFKQCTQELSPKTLYRKKKVNERIAKLKMYGEPPPLSPISIINKSVKATNSYKSPLSSNNPIDIATNCIANTSNLVTNLHEESPKTVFRDLSTERSSVISMQRSYVRTVNPVKLNFSETVTIDSIKNDSTDHFAEEFDGSPPLSLD